MRVMMDVQENRVQTKPLRTTLALCVLLALPTLSSLTASADERDARAVSLSRSLQSPYCPGRALWDCPSERASDMRRDIRDMVAAGATDKEIVSHLKEKAPGFDFYGGTQAEVFSVFPVVILLLSSVVMAYVGFRWWKYKQGKTERAGSSPTVHRRENPKDDPFDDKLDQELSRR